MNQREPAKACKLVTHNAHIPSPRLLSLCRFRNAHSGSGNEFLRLDPTEWFGEHVRDHLVCGTIPQIYQTILDFLAAEVVPDIDVIIAAIHCSVT